MKKTLITLVFVVAMVVPSAFANNPISIDGVSADSAEVASSFKVVNDTGGKVSIHTGSGFVSLNKGSSTSVSCSSGKKVTLANKGKKGRVLFTISSSMCGKRIKLSDYM